MRQRHVGMHVHFMDPKLVGASASGVRVFTCFVLSGSLFLLIYNVGRRRINAQNSRPHRDPTPATPDITNPSYSAGYFSHLKNKPLAHHRNPSLTVALEGPFSTRTIEAKMSSTATNEAGTSCDATGAIADNDTSGDFHWRRDFPQFLNSSDQDASSTPPNFNRKRRSSVAGHEGYMIEHMRRGSQLEKGQGSSGGDSFDIHQRRSSSSFLGDMSHLEKFAGNLTQARKSVTSPKPVVKRDFQMEDFNQHTSSVLQMGPVGPSSAPQHFFKPLLHIFIWCVLSYSLNEYSSTGLGAKMIAFPAPYMKATVHFLMQSVISYCIMRWPGNNHFFIPWKTFIFTVLPIATASALDHDIRDPSIFLVTLGVPMSSRPEGFLEQAYMTVSSFKGASFETVWDARHKPKGYVPLWVFLFGLAFRLESRSVSMVISVAVIAGGFMLAVAKDTKLGFMGFKENAVGPVLSGFRWAATQVLLQKRELGLMTPAVTMRALSPAMALVTAVLALVGDPWTSMNTTEFFDTPDHALKSFGHIIIGALLATALALAELVVVYHTSALTMIILGMLKDLFVLIPRMFHDNEFSKQNILGVAVFLIGLGALIWLKYQRLMTRIRLESLHDDAFSRLKSFFSSLLAMCPSITPEISPIHYVLHQCQAVVELIRNMASLTRLSRKIQAIRELFS